MYCDECKKNLASVQVTQVVNGKKTEQHLCPECAAKKGLMMFNFDIDMSLPKLFSSLFEGYKPAAAGAIAGDLVCPNCGMHLSQFSQMGRLGCSECYKAFDEPLEPLLRRLHGQTQHVGSIPGRQGKELKIKREIMSLKEQLREAVMKEQYEKAAELRDKIKSLENRLK